MFARMPPLGTQRWQSSSMTVISGPSSGLGTTTTVYGSIGIGPPPRDKSRAPHSVAVLALQALAKIEAARPGGGKAAFLIADICGEAEESHDADTKRSLPAAALKQPAEKQLPNFRTLPSVVRCLFGWLRCERALRRGVLHHIVTIAPKQWHWSPNRPRTDQGGDPVSDAH